MSFTFGPPDPNYAPVIVEAINYATTYGREGKGAVIVVAAGNTANYEANPQNIGGIFFPANVTNSSVITVGASDRNDMQANYSPTASSIIWNGLANQVIDVVAPSHKAYSCQISDESYDIWTIDIPGDDGYNKWYSNTGDCGVNQGGTIPLFNEQLPSTGTNYNAYTGRMGGTSAAAPLVAGIAGLVLSVNSCLTAQEVFDIITTTSDQIGGYTYTDNVSNEVGWGRVNAFSAVTAASEMPKWADLYSKNNVIDYGNEPPLDLITNPIHPYYNLPNWISDDIWIRNNCDNGTEHEDPVYDETDPVCVYVKIRNRGCIASELAELKVYWTKATTSGAWDSEWSNYYNPNISDCDAGLIFGDEITNDALLPDNSTTNPNPLHATALSIPVIQPGEEAILEVEWRVPDPSDFSGNCALGLSSHFCLLSRIVTSGSYPYGMTYPETSSNWFNVQDNNNIVQKNITIIDNDPSHIVDPNDGKIIVRNSTAFTTLTKLKFDIPFAEETNPYMNYGRIEVNLGETLYEKWEDGGFEGDDIEVCGTNTIRISGPHAWIGNLEFDANEAVVINPIFDLYVQPSKCQFNFDISQWTEDTEDALVGGCRFDIRTCYPNTKLADKENKPAKPTETVQSYSLRPNPNSGHFTLTQTKDYIKKWQLISIMGQTVQQGKIQAGITEHEIDMSQLVKGIYILKLETNDGVKAERVVYQ